MNRYSAQEAIAQHVKRGSRVLLGTGAGEPLTLERALIEQADQLEGLTLLGGLQISEYEFMEPVRAGRWSYETWHVMGPIRDDVAAGRVQFHPSRGSRLLDLIDRLRPDVFLTVVSPPDRAGRCSFGASVSYALPMSSRIPVVIAEVNPNMPFTLGNSTTHESIFTATVAADLPLPSFRDARRNDVSRRIANFVRPLIPADATLQIGIGSVPEAVMALLAEDPPERLVLFGMGVDALVDLLDRQPTLEYIGGELLGSEVLYRYVHRHPRVRQFANEEILSIDKIRRRPRFVSLQSALQIDLWGQVNAEFADGRQVSGAGGGLDFVEGAWQSAGGFSVIALPSTAAGGSASRIVAQLPPGTPVSVPRHTVRYVVTEYGVVDLFGQSLSRRAESLLSIAHPSFQGALARDLEVRLRSGVAGRAT